MKIAQVAPLLESVPPKLYGGTERVVSYLTEELVQQGHTVYKNLDLGGQFMLLFTILGVESHESKIAAGYL